MNEATSPKRVALVTGGIGGLGSEICRQLAQAGRQVIAIDLAARDERIAAFRQEMADVAGTVTFEPGDISDFDNCQQLIARIEQLTVRPDHVAKVVIEERTGTVVLGANTRIDPVAISHGSLIVKVETRTNVSQPAPFSNGQTVVTQESNISVNEEDAKTVVFQSGTTLGALIKALNALGVKPREMISIVQNIKAAGALNAHLDII